MTTATPQEQIHAAEQEAEQALEALAAAFTTRGRVVKGLLKQAYDDGGRGERGSRAQVGVSDQIGQARFAQHLARRLRKRGLGLVVDGRP